LRTATARGVALAGLAGCLVWSVVVEMAMPSWFDLDDSCPGATRADTSYFPPSASCRYKDGHSLAYISTAKTVVLTVILVLLAAMTLTALAILSRRLLRENAAAPARPHPVRHVLGAAALGLVTCAVARFCVLAGLFLGGPPGGITTFVLIFLCATGAAGALESAYALGSRRRATFLTGAGLAATVALVLATWDSYAGNNTLLGPAWTIPACGAIFALIAAAQWLPRQG
jgi:hypothetical protein